MRSLKVKVVGDTNVGKTSLLSRWYDENYSSEVEHRSPSTSIPPVQESYFVSTNIESRRYVVTFWDTCTMRSMGGIDLSKVRPLEYEETDVFLACFDIADPKSFQNVSTVWVPELKYYMPGTPIVVVGNKMDLRSSGDSNVLISMSKGRELAKRLGTFYLENSSLTGDGVADLIEAALQYAIIEGKSEKTKKGFKLFQNKTAPNKTFYNEMEPPLLLHPGPEQITIKIQESTYSSEMRKLMSNISCSDITLNSNSTQFQAHKIILCSGSLWFRDVLLKGTKDCQLESHTKNIHPEAFRYLLDFLYTFKCNLTTQTSHSLVQEISKTAELVKLPELVECCRNITQYEEYLNGRVCDDAMEKKNRTVRDLFVDKPVLSDVTFAVDGNRIYGHKAVLMARSDVLAAMLGGSFKEGTASSEICIQDTSESAFVGMLEYLYTDSMSVSLEDTKKLLVLSDRFCLPRLQSLCESSISQAINAEMRRKVRLSRKTCSQVISALMTAKAHNATQLYKWCLYTIKTNFPDFEFHEDLSLLMREDREDVTRNRWPPVTYLQQLEEFKKSTYRVRRGKK